MNALRVETCILYMYFKETSLISHASLESWNKESINQKACTMYHVYTSEIVDQSNCIQLPRDIICVPIGSQLLRSKILWMKHVVFLREPAAVIPHSTGDWLTGRWDSRQVLRHCHHLGKPQPAQDIVHHSSFDTAIQNQDFSRTLIENIQK